jgi:hypothetical protein
MGAWANPGCTQQPKSSPNFSILVAGLRLGITYIIRWPGVSNQSAENAKMLWERRVGSGFRSLGGFFFLSNWEEFSLMVETNGAFAYGFPWLEHLASSLTRWID